MTSIYSRPKINVPVLLEVAVVGSSVPSKAAGVPLDALVLSPNDGIDLRLLT